MTIANTFGDTIPKFKEVQRDVKGVCLKTTRYILKKHVHLSPIIVDTSLPNPIIANQE